MKVRLNTALDAIRGHLDGHVYRQYRGKQFLQRKPTFTGEWGQGTLKTRATFGAGDQWYKTVVKPDPVLAQLYRERGKPRQLNYRQMALRDFFNPPSIDRLDTHDYRQAEGGVLAVYAVDDFEVVRVAFTVRDADGRVAAEGDATLTHLTWRFTLPRPASGAPLPVSVEVTAYDRPGNATTRTFSLETG